ncbi:DUF6986 family protein [Nocardia macrotermitis]|uniref:Aldolase n=1 Tax=Nocardia macrotermitis TaxID=2585198 RepID=A0A7K0CZ18_9NOCA|nr:aldolase/citrate lyase family protein [Nocardia macrotermitis]MQY18670.1 hypothetical protein [Nocardia macrotermitis]
MTPRIDLHNIGEQLRAVDTVLRRQYPGDRPGQPVHTVYVNGAHAAVDLPGEWGATALRLSDQHAEQLLELVGPGVLARTRNMLRQRPIQDLRLDFEDGYGIRGDAVEDNDARWAGRVLAALPPAVFSRGVRVKGLTVGEYDRAIRTLELVLDGAGGVPEGFVFTVPKLRAVEQVKVAVQVCELLESVHGIASGTLRFELQIESPQAVIAADGSAVVARAIQRSGGRCTGLHYGTYDYSAACGIAPQFQSLEHPVADHAKTIMQVAAAQTGVWVCDGSTQVLPVGDTAPAALERHFRLVTRALERGYYQGWDMHPGHLITRWAATFTFFRNALRAAAPRIDDYLRRRGGAVVDEPATAQALATVVLRGLDCGAFDPEDVTALAPDASVEVLTQLRERKVPEL